MATWWAISRNPPGPSGLGATGRARFKHERRPIDQVLDQSVTNADGIGKDDDIDAISRAGLESDGQVGEVRPRRVGRHWALVVCGQAEDSARSPGRFDYDENG
jgi:hypothetical protein